MTEHPVLSIGAIVGGPDGSESWLTATRELGRRIEELRAGVVSPLSVNVVYQIPGRYAEPDFVGVRTGRFARKDSALIVQVAVPRGDSSDVNADAFAMLHEAVSEAERFAQKRSIVSGPLVGIRSIVDQIAAS